MANALILAILENIKIFSACILAGGQAKGNITCNAHGHTVIIIGKSGPNYEPITVHYIVHTLALYKHYIVILTVL